MTVLLFQLAEHWDHLQSEFYKFRKKESLKNPKLVVVFPKSTGILMRFVTLGILMRFFTPEY